MSLEKREFIDSLLRVKGELVGKIFRSFSESDQEVIFEKWPYLKDDKELSLEKLRAHLVIALHESDVEAIEESPFLRIANSPVFSMGADGQLTLIENGRKAEKEQIPFLAVDNFVLLLNSSDFQKALRISSSQLQELLAIASLMEECRQEVAELATKPVVSPEEARKDSLLIKKLQADAYAKAYKELTSLLDKNQWDTYESFLSKICAVNRGPMVDLLDGELGERLALSSLRKQELRQDWKVALKELGLKSSKIEIEMIEKFEGFLPENAKSSFKKLIGPDPNQKSANLDLLLQAF